jgi:hypothetical protein
MTSPQEHNCHCLNLHFHCHNLSDLGQRFCPNSLSTREVSIAWRNRLLVGPRYWRSNQHVKNRLPEYPRHPRAFNARRNRVLKRPQYPRNTWHTRRSAILEHLGPDDQRRSMSHSTGSSLSPTRVTVRYMGPGYLTAYIPIHTYRLGQRQWVWGPRTPKCSSRRDHQVAMHR